MLNENRNFLKEYGEYILEKYDSFQADKENYTAVESKNGFPNLLIKRGDKKVSLHSIYNPVKEAENFVSNIDVKKDVIVLVGFGFGYHIEELTKVYKQEIIVVEPDFNVFYNYLDSRRIGDLLLQNKVTLFFEGETTRIAKVIATKILEGMDVGIYFWNAHKVLFEDIEKELINWVKYCIEDNEINVRVQHYSSDIWTENFIFNLPKILKYPGVGATDNKYKNVPAIIVCAGPSLNKNIEVLKGLKDRALIFSTGSAIGPLNKHGIKPHIAVGLDGWETNMGIYNDNIDLKGVALMCNMEFYHGVVDKFDRLDNNILFYTCGYYVREFLKDEFNKDIKGYSANFSVSYNALQIAYTMGCNPIIVVGQDLCFYEKSYADGAAFIEDISDKMKSELKCTKDIHGNQVYTNRSFEGVSTAFSLWVKSSKDRQFFNCTEGGLNIEGFENRTLLEVANKFLNEEISFTLNIEKDLSEELSKKLDVYKIKLENYLKKIDKCLELCAKYEDAIPKSTVNTAIKYAYDIHYKYRELLKDQMYVAFQLALANTLEAYIAKYNRESKSIDDDMVKAKMAIDTYKKAFIYLQYKYGFAIACISKVVGEVS